MGTTVNLGDHFENFAKQMIDNGRYNNTSELVRDGLRIIEARELRLAELDRALQVGLADEAAGRVKPLDEVVGRLKEKYTRMAQERGEL